MSFFSTAANIVCPLAVLEMKQENATNIQFSSREMVFVKSETCSSSEP